MIITFRNPTVIGWLQMPWRSLTPCQPQQSKHQHTSHNPAGSSKEASTPSRLQQHARPADARSQAWTSTTQQQRSKIDWKQLPCCWRWGESQETPGARGIRAAQARIRPATVRFRASAARFWVASCVTPGGGGGCDFSARPAPKLLSAASGKFVVFAIAAGDVVGYAAAWKLVVAPRYGLEEEIHERVGAAVRNPREGFRRMRRRAFFSDLRRRALGGRVGAVRFGRVHTSVGR